MTDNNTELLWKCEQPPLQDAIAPTLHTIFFSQLIDVSKSIFNCFTASWLLIFLAAIWFLILYILYKTYCDPIVYTKELTEVGFEHISSGPDRMKNISRVQSLRKIGAKIPPPFPNGWFAIAESRDLKVGGVQAVDALGQNLCVFRGEDGIARCVDAYCPHLGANLGIGGSVCGNCIECPFHKWRFDEHGACVAVPGTENAPKGVSIKKWECVEADGAVWVWHDAEERPPQWGLQDAPECRRWGYRGRNEFTVSAHIQEIPENGADVAHLNAVHATSLITSIGDRFPKLNDIIGRHVWNATWHRNEDHTAKMNLIHDYKLMKYAFFHTELDITQMGPGHVRLRLQTPAGPFLISQSVTPIGPLLQRVVHRMFSPMYNAVIARPIVVNEGRMFERDIRIWNNKMFVSAPTYVKADKTIRSFRNWYSQFYSENSISYKDCVQNSLEW